MPAAKGKAKKAATPSPTRSSSRLQARHASKRQQSEPLRHDGPSNKRADTRRTYGHAHTHISRPRMLTLTAEEQRKQLEAISQAPPDPNATRFTMSLAKTSNTSSDHTSGHEDAIKVQSQARHASPSPAALAAEGSPLLLEGVQATAESPHISSERPQAPTSELQRLSSQQENNSYPTDYGDEPMPLFSYSPRHADEEARRSESRVRSDSNGVGRVDSQKAGDSGSGAMAAVSQILITPYTSKQVHQAERPQTAAPPLQELSQPSSLLSPPPPTHPGDHAFDTQSSLTSLDDVSVQSYSSPSASFNDAPRKILPPLPPHGFRRGQHQRHEQSASVLVQETPLADQESLGRRLPGTRDPGAPDSTPVKPRVMVPRSAPPPALPPSPSHPHSPPKDRSIDDADLPPPAQPMLQAQGSPSVAAAREAVPMSQPAPSFPASTASAPSPAAAAAAATSRRVMTSVVIARDYALSTAQIQEQARAVLLGALDSSSSWMPIHAFQSPVTSQHSSTAKRSQPSVQSLSTSEAHAAEAAQERMAALLAELDMCVPVWNTSALMSLSPPAPAESTPCGDALDSYELPVVDGAANHGLTVEQIRHCYDSLVELCADDDTSDVLGVTVEYRSASDKPGEERSEALKASLVVHCLRGRRDSTTALVRRILQKSQQQHGVRIDSPDL